MNDHILIVEDDTSMRENIAVFLETAGYHVTQVADGETALLLLDQAAQDGIAYGVVVTDIIMGRVDGIQVMKVAKTQPYRPEVILLTGHGSLETAMAALRTQAFDYLLKPCRITTLLERIAAASERRYEQQRKEERAKIARAAMSPSSASGEERHERTDEEPPELPRDGMVVGLSEATRYLTIGLLRIDTHRYEVWFNSMRLDVTPTEYAILVYLASSAGRACTFADITHHTHGMPLERDDAQKLLGTHIRNLRKKLDRRYLVSVRGVGYMMIDPDDKNLQ